MKHYYTIHIFYHLPNNRIGLYEALEDCRMTACEAIDYAMDIVSTAQYPIAGVQIYKQYLKEGKVYGLLNVGAHSFHETIH